MSEDPFCHTLTQLFTLTSLLFVKKHKLQSVTQTTQLFEWIGFV